MFRFRGPSATLPSNTCVVKTSVEGFEGQQVLKCTGGFLTAPKHTYTGFRDQQVNGNGLDYLFGNDDFTTPDTVDNFKIELGLFTGGGCLVDAPATLEASSTASDVVSSTLETPSPSSDAVFSSASVDSAGTTLTPSPV